MKHTTKNKNNKDFEKQRPKTKQNKNNEKSGEIIM